MTEKELMELKAGEEVYWTDPDNDECSGYLTIGHICVDDEIVQIRTQQDTYVECLLEELSL
jgi:hypothetical protein